MSRKMSRTVPTTLRARGLQALVALALTAFVVPLAGQTYNPDGATHDPTKASGWSAPAAGATATAYNDCLRCHRPGGPSGAADATSYLLGGHKNMSRAADGKPWGIPGVDATHAASPWLEDASLDGNGFFTNLWIQEEYVRPSVNWTVASGAAPSSITGGYCAKSPAGDIGSDDTPDLAACPTCETPDMGNGNAGYPLNYPDAAACSAAAQHTGKPYTWIPLNTQPLFWIYGGAGLEGGPAMIQRGSQQYKCARCHTTGWKANQASDAAVTGKAKRPYSDFPAAGLDTMTTLGATSKLLGPSFGASAYPVVKSPCTTGTDCDVTGVVLTAKGASYPTSTPATVTISDATGTGCTATAVMAPDSYGTTYKVNGVTVDCTAGNHSYSSGAKVAISHPYSVSSWDQWGIQCSRCHTGAVDGNHGNTTLSSAKGGDIVASCMTCHRQESDTAPRSIQGGNGFAANNGLVLPYTNKQQQPDGFAHHPDGNEFLNSPHALFTGNWKDMGCPPYAINGYAGLDPGNPGAPGAGACTPGVMNLDGKTASAYASKFAQAAKVDLKGISDTSAGSCTTCHDVHKPLNENSAGMGGSVRTACTDCHANAAAKVTPQVSVSAMQHRGGPGTPFANAAADPSSACITCHQPPGIKHLWRISTDPAYMLFGDYTYAYPVNGAAAQSTGSNAPGLVNLSHATPDGAYPNAVWVDLDNACGQCHGGGVWPAELTTTGSVTAGGANGSINPVTVADVFGFESGKEITIAGAGWAGADFRTVIAKVVADASPATSGKVYLTYPAVASVSNAAVTVAGNPPLDDVPYYTRTQLSVIAKGIHGKSLIAASVGYSRSGNVFTFQAKDLVCPNEPCAATWDFGDGSMGSGTPATHDYGASFGSVASYTVVVTVTDALGARTTASTTLVPYPASAHPYADGSDVSWTFTQPGRPTSVNVTFAAQTAVEAGYDYIHVMDGSGNEIAGSPFTGTTLAGTTRTVPGDTVRIRLTSDGSLALWGFEVTKVSGVGGSAAKASILSVVDGATLSGRTRIMAGTSGDTDVTRTELYIDGTLAASADSSTLSYSWNTLGVATGRHVLVTRVHDEAGNVTASAPVTVNVVAAVPGATGHSVIRRGANRSHSGD